MISFVVTVHNEIEEIQKLLPILQENSKENDEIIIQLDSKATKEIRNLLSKEYRIILIEYSLNNHFANFKNHLAKQCKKEWIFNIDADEIPSIELISNIHEILELNKDVDVIRVPRINIVRGLTEEDIKKYHWIINDKGWVNFPDYQTRIWKNTSSIFWKNKVHEILSGYSSITDLPAQEEYCLIHDKNIERQRKQNEFYMKYFRG